MKYLNLEHSRTFSTKCFPPSYRKKCFTADEKSARVSFPFKVRELSVSFELHQLVKLTFSQLQIFYHLFHIRLFYDINNTWSQCYKTFYVRNLRTFALSQSVCQPPVEKFFKVKHTTLLRKCIIYGQKSFITLAPGHIFLECRAIFDDSQTGDQY